MKKVILALVAVVLFCTAKAQSEITVGPKVGFNVSNVSNISDAKNKISVNVGGFVEFRVSDFFSLQPEVLYSRQGFRVKSNGINHKMRINYLNIPILARLYVLQDFSVDLGPQIGFALNGKDKWKHDGHTSKDKFSNMKTLDVSFAIGLSYNWSRLLFSARYNLGLTNVFDKDDVGGDNNKNHVFQLSVGYRFGNLFK